MHAQVQSYENSMLGALSGLGFVLLMQELNPKMFFFFLVVIIIISLLSSKVFFESLILAFHRELMV